MLFLPSIAATIYTQCDKVMIELITGNSSQVAFYDYSEKIVTIPLTFITALSTVMMPRIANEFKKGNNAKIQNLLISAAPLRPLWHDRRLAGLPGGRVHHRRSHGDRHRAERPENAD